MALGVEVRGAADRFGGDELVHGGAIVGGSPAPGTVGGEQGEQPGLGRAVPACMTV